MLRKNKNKKPEGGGVHFSRILKRGKKKGGYVYKPIKLIPLAVWVCLCFLGLFVVDRWTEVSSWMKASILDFDTENVSDGNKISAVEGVAGTPEATGPIFPILECVDLNVNQTITAYFGYDNQNPEPINIPIGPKNKFTPSPQNRGQPSDFEPGMHVSVFQVTFSDQHLTWSLRGPGGVEKTIKASTDSPLCSPGNQNTNGLNGNDNVNGSGNTNDNLNGGMNDNDNFNGDTNGNLNDNLNNNLNDNMNGSENQNDNTNGGGGSTMNENTNDNLNANNNFNDNQNSGQNQNGNESLNNNVNENGNINDNGNGEMNSNANSNINDNLNGDGNENINQNGNGNENLNGDTNENWNNNVNGDQNQNDNLNGNTNGNENINDNSNVGLNSNINVNTNSSGDGNSNNNGNGNINRNSNANTNYNTNGNVVPEGIIAGGGVMFHLGCFNDRCIYVSGKGNDECMTDNDCLGSHTREQDQGILPWHNGKTDPLLRVFGIPSYLFQYAPPVEIETSILVNKTAGSERVNILSNENPFIVIAPTAPSHMTRGMAIQFIIEKMGQCLNVLSNKNNVTTLQIGVLPYRDVSPGSDFYPFILEAYKRGILEHYEMSRFESETLISRGEFVGLVMKTYRIVPDACPLFATDLKGDEWYEGYVRCAYASGIIPGQRVMIHDQIVTIVNASEQIYLEEAQHILQHVQWVVIRSLFDRTVSIVQNLLL